MLHFDENDFEMHAYCRYILEVEFLFQATQMKKENVPTLLRKEL